MRVHAAHAHATRPQRPVLIRSGFSFPSLAGLGQDSTDTSGLDSSTLTDLQNLPSSFDSSSLAPISLDVTNSGPSSTLAQDLTAFGNAAGGVSRAVNASAGPYVIPGTSLVYNPATGQLAGQTALGTAAAGAVGSFASSFASMIPIIAVVVLGGFLLESMGGRK